MFACDTIMRCGADTKPLHTARLCHLRHVPSKLPTAPLQVPVLEDAAGKLGAEPAPAPVLSWDAFRALCEAPPLQARTAAIKHDPLALALSKVISPVPLQKACARHLNKPVQVQRLQFHTAGPPRNLSMSCPCAGPVIPSPNPATSARPRCDAQQQCIDSSEAAILIQSRCAGVHIIVRKAMWGCMQAASLALAPRTFEPLGPSEAPGRGTLLALDAEFVAHSPPDTELRGCAWSPCAGLRVCVT